jgi:hypothetical protein
LRWIDGRADTATLVCTDAGGVLDYASFRTSAALHETLVRASPPEPICIQGQIMIGDGNVGDRPDPFGKMCARLHGRLIRWAGQS